VVSTSFPSPLHLLSRPRMLMRGDKSLAPYGLFRALLAPQLVARSLSLTTTSGAVGSILHCPAFLLGDLTVTSRAILYEVRDCCLVAWSSRKSSVLITLFVLSFHLTAFLSGLSLWDSSPFSWTSRHRNRALGKRSEEWTGCKYRCSRPSESQKSNFLLAATVEIF
jgi:hypothetical protein